jgi:hypothetical protein
VVAAEDNRVQFSPQKDVGGWRYNPGDPGDTCVLVWQLAALRSAQLAGLRVNNSVFAGANRWLNSCAKGQNGSLYSYQPTNSPSNTMTAAGLRSRQYLGVKRDSPMMVTGGEFLMGQPPDASNPNVYYWYYASQVTHAIGGNKWDTWDRNVRKVLIDLQNKEHGSCAEGSWNPVTDPWGAYGGRLMMTSLATLILEIGTSKLPIYK